MPFQLGWIPKQQNKEKIEEDSDLPDLIKLNIDLQRLVTTEITKLRHELSRIAAVMHKVDEDYKVVPPTAGQEHVPSRTFPVADAINNSIDKGVIYNDPLVAKRLLISKSQKKGLYTQRQINRRHDPLFVVHKQNCGMMRVKSAWKRHANPAALIKWSHQFNNDKWANKKIVIATCTACLPQEEISVPEYWIRNANARYLKQQQPGRKQQPERDDPDSAEITPNVYQYIDEKGVLTEESVITS